MTPLEALCSRYAAPGQITWIGLRPARKEAPISVPSAVLETSGLIGDHARPGKRAVTLFQAEHLPVVAAFSRQEIVAPEILRRNIMVSGINLSAWRGVRLRLGHAVIEITVPCAPCSRMEAALGHGGYNAMRGHGGRCATVLEPGDVAIGARVEPVG